MKMWCEFSGQPSQSGGKKKGIVCVIDIDGIYDYHCL
jgi:hypothetical protein